MLLDREVGQELGLYKNKLLERSGTRKLDHKGAPSPPSFFLFRIDIDEYRSKLPFFHLLSLSVLSLPACRSTLSAEGRLCEEFPLFVNDIA